jgi:threonine dehydrogenase-like Zn-dependent dehydrogenase
MEDGCEMKARIAKVTAPCKLEIVEEDKPKPGPGEVLVRVKSCGLCHTDLPIFQGRKGPFERKMVGEYEVTFQRDNPEFPYAIGHEPAGVVEEVGPGVTKFKVGDRVAGPSAAGFATHTIMEARKIVRVPDELPLDLTLAEPLMCVTSIVRAANPEIGDYVAVIGAGFMGLLVDAALAKYPVRELIALDFIDERLDWARKMGATITINPRKENVQERIAEITNGRGVDIAIDITGRYGGLDLATKMIKVGRGKILIPSYYGQPETVDLGTELMLKSPVIHSTHPAYSRDYLYDVETGLWAAAKGVFPIGDLITHRFRFEDIDEAFEVLASNPQGYIKGIVTID